MEIIMNEEPKEIKLYTIIGKHDFIDDNDRPRVSDNESNSMAKSIIKNNKERFFIKTSNYGKLFNPLGMYSEGKQKKFLSKIGKSEFNFKEVNMKVFNMYINFLSSRNAAWLNNAQRELN